MNTRIASGPFSASTSALSNDKRSLTLSSNSNDQISSFIPSNSPKLSNILNCRRFKTIGPKPDPTPDPTFWFNTLNHSITIEGEEITKEGGVEGVVKLCVSGNSFQLCHTTGEEENTVKRTLISSKSNLVKSAKISIERWTNGMIGSDVQVEFGIEKDEANPLTLIQISIDTHQSKGFSSELFEKLQGRLRIWGNEGRWTAILSVEKPIAIPPPSSSNPVASTSRALPTDPEPKEAVHGSSVYDFLDPPTWVPPLPQWSEKPSTTTDEDERSGLRSFSARRIEAEAVLSVRQEGKRVVRPVVPIGMIRGESEVDYQDDGSILSSSEDRPLRASLPSRVRPKSGTSEMTKLKKQMQDMKKMIEDLQATVHKQGIKLANLEVKELRRSRIETNLGRKEREEREEDFDITEKEERTNKKRKIVDDNDLDGIINGVSSTSTEVTSGNSTRLTPLASTSSLPPLRSNDSIGNGVQSSAPPSSHSTNENTKGKGEPSKRTYPDSFSVEIECNPRRTSSNFPPTHSYKSKSASTYTSNSPKISTPLPLASASNLSTSSSPLSTISTSPSNPGANVDPKILKTEAKLKKLMEAMDNSRDELERFELGGKIRGYVGHLESISRKSEGQ